jgi:hypothetical protein
MTRQKLTFIILSVLPFVFAWLLIGQIVQSQLTADKLVKVTGVVESSEEVTTHVRKNLFNTHQDIELRIYLQGKTDYYRVMEVYNYQRFQEQIVNGSTAEIFIRPAWMVPLGLGRKNDVFQMNINGQTIFDLSETRRNGRGIIIVCLIAIPLFIMMARWSRRKERKRKQVSATGTIKAS